MKMNFDDFRAIREMTAQPRMQRARPRNMRQQILHLVRKYSTALEINVLGVVRCERNRYELHRSLLWRSATLIVVATATGRRDVGPGISTAARHGRNVVARQIPRHVTHATVQAQVRIALEQRAIVERRNILVAIA